MSLKENDMKITVSRAELVDKEACSDGLNWFDNLARQLMQGPDITIEWDALSMIWALCSDGRGYVRWAIEEGVLPQWSLSRANLYGANLNGADLYGANLNGADLYGANLNGAYLSGAYLSGANLECANLSYANLYGANLSNANLSYAYLRGANLERAYYPTGDVPEGWRRTETGHLTKA